MVFVLSKEGKPLMPTNRHGKVKHLLRQGRARVVKRHPFTIQLNYDTTGYTQPVTLGIDSSCNQIGFSAVTEGRELIAGQVELLTDISENLRQRRAYRRQRRRRRRYRALRIDNRRRPENWLAPSIAHYHDAHIRLVNKLKKLLPIGRIVVEIANFDARKLTKDQDRVNFWNLREYILHRDGYRCQNPRCRNNSRRPILQTHHLNYWRGDRDDYPENLITLCSQCHRSANHRKGRFLWGWKPRILPWRDVPYLSKIRRLVVENLRCDYTFGYLTKQKRVALKMKKSRINDAYLIAGGVDQHRAVPIFIKETRRNNRSLEGQKEKVKFILDRQPALLYS
ncbi:MAG: RNA-guided endonuclease IscB [Limnochordia bacterium]|jgi:hypothetical protein